jgi:hypothetical protein
VGGSVSGEFAVCVFRRLSEDGGRLFLQKNIHTRLLCGCVERYNPNAFWFKKIIK